MQLSAASARLAALLAVAQDARDALTGMFNLRPPAKLGRSRAGRPMPRDNAALARATSNSDLAARDSIVDLISECSSRMPDRLSRCYVFGVVSVWRM